ncbi:MULTISPECIES: Lrp/AsnC family transcriptional regulator [Novosphingobium]|uniref:Lrp/AsnC family transcriptional regulator n=1 Tax=Novosphingobium pokkalii TaxID=1770194 RepID=A0ABV7V320_9SPHN|nr:MULTISPECIES: Lrp/AsnC family transcriptional regulator [Novosphingobium]NKJ44387.1 Lrp/AsnC family transcriptional regulator [Novosphingobium sp. SG720]NMN05154.1 Lrp/AsnC family transcriptional regulator [Novosphingobium sp. SG919]NMN87449.1 Lrp/AsnC family transcriptional regulator [Novosphingobium sp. SG916]GHC83897.1 transcriptional regulator [Novosphingobium pokkalii]
MAEPLSPIDLKILDQIQKDASLSTTELAEKVGLSQSPCWRRLQRLREEGYIKGQVALLDRKQLGDAIIVFATLKMAALSDKQREDFLRKIEITPEILECHTIFGERDIMIKVIAQSLEWYQKFIFKVVLKLPGVIDIVSTVTLSELKHTTAIPVRGFASV